MNEVEYTLDEVMEMFMEVEVKLPVSWYNKYYKDTGEFSLDSEKVFKQGFKNKYWEEGICERVERLGIEPEEMLQILENEHLIDSDIWPILEEYEEDKQEEIRRGNT